jgi:serine/threonine-protein kinase
VVASVTDTIPRIQRRKRRWWKRIVGYLLVLALVGAAVWGAWTYAIPHTSPVPPVRGLTVEKAERSLTDLGLVVRYEDARHDPSGEFAAGTVLAQDPPPGTELEEGQVVTLVPSLGPPPVPIPEVTIFP